jgi:hypothetical protein
VGGAGGVEGWAMIDQCSITHLREGLPPVPLRMRGLPLDERGYPVPYFVEWIDGKPDFRVTSQVKRVDCWRFKKCWLCGKPLGRFMSAVIGPMCVITRTSSEPFSHRDCCEFAVKACPFLSIPSAKRREACLPENDHCPGDPILRNPGVAAIYATENPFPFGTGDGNFLFNVGDPLGVTWWAEGRLATREEVLYSIETGLPALEEACEKEDGPERQAAARADLAARVKAIEALLP